MIPSQELVSTIEELGVHSLRMKQEPYIYSQCLIILAKNSTDLTEK